MDALEKLGLLSAGMQLEPSEEHGSSHPPSSCHGVVVYNAHLPNGKRFRLLKSLLSSACESDCAYCPFRAGRDFQRITFKAEEFSNLVIRLQQAGIIQGVFLSSGLVGGGVRTQDLLLTAVEILRNKHKYDGYIHLKIMPGAEYSQVERALQLADRISINLEAPNPRRLKVLAPSKVFWDQLWQPIQWTEQIRNTQSPMKGWKNRWPSTTTQFVVGGADESDLELLQTTQTLQHEVKLKRAYYSAFTPHRDTPLENHPATTHRREQRLYEAFFLLQDYGFHVEEFIYDNDGNLSSQNDPKMTWANLHLLHQPIEINTADWQTLLRIPGIGPHRVKQIIEARKQHTLNDLSALSKIGISSSRVSKFILLNGKRPMLQPSLW